MIATEQLAARARAARRAARARERRARLHAARQALRALAAGSGRVLRRHSGHRRRRARDERGRVRRRDVDARRERDDDRSPRRRARRGRARSSRSAIAACAGRPAEWFLGGDVSLRARRIELDGRDQGAARATQRGAAARVSELRLRVPQSARRLRGPAHRAGRAQGPAASAARWFRTSTRTSS